MTNIVTQVITPTSFYIKFANNNEFNITKTIIQDILQNTTGNASTKKQAVINQLLTNLQTASGESINLNEIKFLFNETQGDIINFSSGIGSI